MGKGLRKLGKQPRSPGVSTSMLIRLRFPFPMPLGTRPWGSEISTLAFVWFLLLFLVGAAQGTWLFLLEKAQWEAMGFGV